MKGITLSSPAWIVTGVAKDASRFIRALPSLVPHESFLFLEGRAYSDQLLAFLETERVAVSPRPALGTVWPRGAYFVIPAEPRVLEALATVTQDLPYPDVCDHLSVFRGEEVLLSGYDAFTAEFWLSAELPEEKVKAFVDAVGGSYTRPRVEDAG